MRVLLAVLLPSMFLLSGCIGVVDDAIGLGYAVSQMQDGVDQGTLEPDIAFHGTLDPLPGHTLENVHAVDIQEETRRVVIVSDVQSEGQVTIRLCKDYGPCIDVAPLPDRRVPPDVIDFHISGIPIAWPTLVVEAADDTAYSVALYIDRDVLDAT